MSVEASVTPSHTVLLVDDDPRLAPLVTRLLGILGFASVEVAPDAAAARAILASTGIVLVICDLALPGEDGLSLLRWVRGTDGLRNVPFIVTEETFSFEDVIAADELGADGILLKPYDSELFRTKIAAAVGGSARRRRKTRGERMPLEGNAAFAGSLWGLRARMADGGTP